MCTFSLLSFESSRYISFFTCYRCGGGHQWGVDPPGDIHAKEYNHAQSLNTNAEAKYFPLQICLFYLLADGFSGFKIVPWSYIVFLTSKCAPRHVSLSYKLSILSFACTQLWFLFFLLPSSLWCRSVVENFWPGTNGLFQLWLESVSWK